MAEGSQLVFVSPFVDISSGDWIEQMLMYSQRLDVGAVSICLYNPNQTVYNAGYILGLGKNHTAASSHINMPKEYFGYMGKMLYSQDVSAVTKDCMMIKKSTFESINGFDEAYVRCLDDVDMCLKLREIGLLNVFTPYAEGYYYRDKHNDAKTKAISTKEDNERFLSLWKDKACSDKDPFYNPNFSSDIDYLVDFEKVKIVSTR
jgi:GT2 family glycosyltransferase